MYMLLDQIYIALKLNVTLATDGVIIEYWVVNFSEQCHLNNVRFFFF